MQSDRHHPTAQQWVLVPGDVHAEGPGQLGPGRPTQRLCTGHHPGGTAGDAGLAVCAVSPTLSTVGELTTSLIHARPYNY